MYTSKTTLKEDRLSFVRVCSALSRHITYKLVMEKETENKDTNNSDFVVDLRIMLCTIQAYVSTNVVSAPLALYMALNNSSRLSFSHNFSYFLIS